MKRIIRQAEACKHRKLAVQIGINYAGTANALQGCEADVFTLQKALRERFGFTEFIVLTEKAAQADMQPTRANILRVLTDVARRTCVDGVEQVVIQYSGHGTLTGDTTGDELGDESDGLDQALVDKNLQLIVDDTLRAVLDSFSPWCRVLCVIDACHSGSGLDLPLMWPLYSPAVVQRCNTTAPVANVLAISGCGDRETSADTMRTDPATGQQVFGGAMTLALVDSMFASRDVFALMQNMDLWMRRNGYTQHPQLTSSRPLFTGDNLTQWIN